jgi:hypothetical protein
VVLVGLVAAPASADRDVHNGNIPHYSFVYASGSFVGQPLVRELPTGDWAEFGGGWGTVTEDQWAQFLEAVIVEIERDGVPHDFSTELFTNEGEFFEFAAGFTVLIEPGAAKTSEDWLMRWTFTEDHDDGSGDPPIPAGTVWEMPRTIVWTPRGQFPSGDYPPSDF